MHPDFDLPSKGSVSGRTSSITAAFFAAITPVIPPSESEVDEALEVLGMARGNCRCAYCGDQRTEWDHFRPIVKERRPTGFITEIANLVPACGKCNQSKGNYEWATWMFGPAARSPKSRGIADVEERAARLKAYEQWRQPVCLDYASILGQDHWATYLRLLDDATAHLAAAQKRASELAQLIKASLPGREVG